MKRSLPLLLILLVTFGHAQLPKWNYIKEIRFPKSDSAFAVPFLCTVTSSGRLYVISSAATSVGAHNAIYYADSTDTEFHRMVDYNYNGDSDTLTGVFGSLRGIASLNNDIIVNGSVPYQRTKPNTVSTMYYYENGDTNLVSKFGFTFSNPGHGTFHHGVAVTKDTIAIAGVTAGASGPGPFARTYNLTKSITSPVRGAWIGESKLEVGGTHSAGVDVIRDCAVLPGGNYYDSSTVFYTSRNSQSDGNITGGIASWTMGKQFPGTSVNLYESQRVADFEGQLSSFSTNIPYGITVDKNGRLWVCGTDSLKRWVKAYDVAGGTFATVKYELPSQYDLGNPNPNGAPMRGPADVALTPDALTAYVVDVYTRTAYQFKFGIAPNAVRGDAAPFSFELRQNYPNPFNPATVISFELSRSGPVRLVVVNALGQLVATLVDGHREAGRHNETFTAAALPTGVYFYTLSTSAGTITKKMMLVK
ncbi:MAG: T9SS type A sorting domain-containing protein [Bacteroidetes bacterium]|nr:MAG: T9SS type A sorting domain-containing protein [Bacteroidota bacterium]